MAALCMSYIKHSVVKFLDILQPGSCFKAKCFSTSTHTGLQVTNRTARQWYSTQNSITVQQPIKEEGTVHFLCPPNP